MVDKALVQTGVYRIRCLSTGKLYVGSAASSFRERWSEHRRDLRRNRHHSPRLQRAWNKYGEAAFVFEIVEVTERENAVAVEQKYLDLWKVANKRYGFNICPTAGSLLGVKRSAETCEKIAAALRGKPFTESRKANISSGRKGIKASLITRQRMSLARIGKIHTPETRAKMSVSQRSRTFTPEHLANIAAANRSMSPERRAEINAKISKANQHPKRRRVITT